MKVVFRYSLTLLILLSFLSNPLQSQTLPLSGTTIKKNDGTVHFQSNILITNRDYLVYINWLIKVYGAAYPERVWEAIPQDCIIIDRDSLSLSNFGQILSNTNGYWRDYNFNYNYIDYPLIGLDYNQVGDFLKWLSDRYNEIALIKQKGRAIGFFEQSYEDSFSLETHLNEQFETYWMGDDAGEYVVKWEDGILLPAFFYSINKKANKSSNLRKQKRGVLPFLTKWEDFFNENSKAFEPSDTIPYTVVTGEYVYHSIPLFYFGSAELLPVIKRKKIIKDLRQTMFDSYINNFDYNCQYLTSEEEKKSRDIYGQMHYVVLGEDEQSRIVIHKPLRKKEDYQLNGLYSFGYYILIPSTSVK